jgi:hypothetical protein
MEVENWYAGVDGDGFVQQFESAVEEAEGPNLPIPGPFRYCRLPGPPVLPPQPAQTYRLRWIGFDTAPQWVETAPIEQLRAERNAAINAWKLEANNTYFEFADEQISFKDSDRIEIQAVHNWVTLTNTMPTWADWPGAWKAISNRWVPLPDVETWKAFTLAIAERGTAHFKRAQQLKATLAAAATPAEIEAIIW